MKLLSLFALVMPLTAQAAGPFRPDSQLPTELQAKVLAAVKAQCSSSLFGLEEDQTVIAEKIDGGLRFRTFLKASYYFEGMHPVGTDIVVESAEYSSPARTEVESVKSSDEVCR